MGDEHAKGSRALGPDLDAHGLQMLGGFVGIELRNPAKRKTEVQRGLEIGNYFKSLGGNYLIAADSGDQRRVQLAGRVGAADGLSDSQWGSLCAGLNELGHGAQRQMAFSLVFHNHVGTYIETEAETSQTFRWDRSIGGRLVPGLRSFDLRGRQYLADVEASTDTA